MDIIVFGIIIIAGTSLLLAAAACWWRMDGWMAEGGGVLSCPVWACPVCLSLSSVRGRGYFFSFSFRCLSMTVDEMSEGVL